MKNRKIILILVEGESDKIALSDFLEESLDSNYIVKVEIACTNDSEIGGDILVCNDPLKKFKEIVSYKMRTGKFKAKDIESIILISDVDGCYLEDSRVLEVRGGKIKYYDDHIDCPDSNSIILRNENKRESIEQLSKTNFVKINRNSIRVYLVLMSLNLEHVLYGLLGIRNRKIKEAKEFSLESDYSSISKIFKKILIGNDNSDFFNRIKEESRNIIRTSNLEHVLNLHKEN